MQRFTHCDDDPSLLPSLLIAAERCYHLLTQKIPAVLLSSARLILQVILRVIFSIFSFTNIQRYCEDCSTSHFQVKMCFYYYFFGVHIIH